MKNVNKKIFVCLLIVSLMPYKAFSQGYTSSFDKPSDIFLEFLLYVSLYPIVGNYQTEDHLHHYLSDYPYQYSNIGNYADPEDMELRNFRIDLENHFLFSENNTYGDHFALRVYPFQYFYFLSNFYQITVFDKEKDFPSSTFFDAMFCYDRLRFQRFNLGWMIGMNYVGNNVNKIGFSGGFNLDWFIFNHFSIQSSANWGINNKENINTFESQLKYHYKKVFFSAGYETIKAQSVRHHFLKAGIGVYL